MSIKETNKRPIGLLTGGTSSDEVYKFQIHLSNGVKVDLPPLREPGPKIPVDEIIKQAKEEYRRVVRFTDAVKGKKRFNWESRSLVLHDANGVKIVSALSFKSFKSHKYHMLFLYDECEEKTHTFENMWDLTPDPELLKELPEDYTFETALADLIDNSLQAVWSNDRDDQRIINVDILEDRISIFDSGPGMDGSEENSIVKWGKMGASLHRSYKEQAVGGKPPYLKPFFGMFGYGGPIASMHLGRRAVVSSKTKNSKKVYFLHLEREALVRSSGSDRSWKTPGGIRDPLEEETENSPHGSFTKVEIFEPKLKKLDIRRIKCWLKDIYFPYIQCDEVSKTGKTVMPVMFQVNGTNLAGIGGGEVAITNIHSSNGPDFVLGLHFSLKQESEKSSSRSCVKANARLKCVYFPASEGKENIERILETLKDDKHKISEQYDNFSRVSIRRLGRLLPDARWAWLPFMDLRHKKGSDKFRLLKRCCFRVKCFIDTDAGMNPTPSKTDLAQQNPFTIALKNFGGNFSESEKVVDINVRRDGKALSLVQLEKEYQDWILEMHNRYDEEVDRGEDQPIIVVSPMQKKGSAIASDVGRFHKVFKRKGETWKSGQKVKLLKGAAPKIHKKNVYATLEYFYLGGFEGDTGGDHRIICRPIDIIAEEGCVLSEVDGQTSFDLRKSLSIPIGVIDSEMCVLVDNAEWKTQIEKERQKSPSSIELLCAKHCLELGFDEEELDTLVEAGKTPPMEVVAVVRPLNYAPESDPKDLDQRDILKWNSDMSLAVKFQDEKSGKVEHLHSAWVTPTQQKGIQGVYVFSLGCKLPRLFYKAGLYKFAFSLVDSSCQTLKEVTVKPSPQIKKWKIIRGIKSPPYSLRVGCTCKLLSVLCHDMYGNRTSFTSKEVRVKLQASAGVGFDVKDLKTALSVSKETLNIQKMRIECRDLDHIRPAYGATLTVASLDGLFSDSIPCVVHPGDIESVESQPPTLENQLLPGCIINELQFRMFDAFHNHALKGSFVDFKFKGFQLLDKLGSKRKVDDCGCVDLNGILKVNASYGQTVSLAVSSNDKVVFEREWLIERRELRIASKVPESLTAGSLLENIKFEVVNSEGDLDMTIHNEEKNGQSHMLTIKADWLNTEHSVRYTFVYGRCCVPAITLPQEEGRFQFQAKHSRHSILSLDVELYLVKPLSLIPEVEYGENQSSQRDPDLSQRDPDLSQRDLDLLLLQDPNPLAVVGKKFMLLTQNQENKCRDKFRVCREEIEKLKKKITRIKAHKDVVEDNIRASQVSDSCSLGFPNGFITREEVVEEIEKRGHSAAMTLYNISRRVPFGEPKDSLVKDVIGIVALLGRVNSFPLSRVLSEYLGEDQMLAVVTRSFEAVSSLEKYRRGGEVDSDDALHGEAIKHGNSIIGRFLVICLEDIRSIMGPCFGLENHQRKLVLPLPSLPNGTVPSGFLGHAVNMIDLDEEHFRIKTRSGLGLRETLFYRLFGNLQVYRTRSEMLSARSCINSSGGAVSLDGGILKENGVVSLGFGDPDICFQVVPAESGTSCSEDDLNELKMDFSELRKTNKVLKELTEELAREMKKYEKMQNRNEELFGTQETGETNDLY